jgi:hypothetical protein
LLAGRGGCICATKECTILTVWSKVATASETVGLAGSQVPVLKGDALVAGIAGLLLEISTKCSQRLMIVKAASQVAGGEGRQRACANGGNERAATVVILVMRNSSLGLQSNFPMRNATSSRRCAAPSKDSPGTYDQDRNSILMASFSSGGAKRSCKMLHASSKDFAD